jgi:hypothetical protein
MRMKVMVMTAQSRGIIQRRRRIMYAVIFGPDSLSLDYTLL